MENTENEIITEETYPDEDIEALGSSVESVEPEAELEQGINDTENIESLKEVIFDLQAKISNLEAEKKAQERILEEIGDFNSLFPEVSIDEIPESIWESVKKGTSLAASYALYEKRKLTEAQRIAQINESNAKRAAGVAGVHTANEYFSPDEVRKMSRSEVHANFAKIRKSMEKWK